MYPPPGIELRSEMSQVSEVNECILQSTPLPSPDVMPEKETCEFQFQIDVGKLDLGNLGNWIWAICIKHTLDTNLTKKPLL